MREAQKILDEIAYETQKAVREIQSTWRDIRRDQSAWNQPAREARATLRRLPSRISDLATDGSCVMRYLFGYFLKGLAIFQGFGGVIAVIVSGPWQPDVNLHQLCIGLLLIATAQIFWLAGRLVHRSADRKRYAQYQHRLLKLAREKDGSLTVLEAATDSRMTVEKAEEILRELALRGHAEVRVSDSGVIVYHFPEIERWDEKHWAKPVDEL